MMPKVRISVLNYKKYFSCALTSKLEKFVKSTLEKNFATRAKDR